MKKNIIAMVIFGFGPVCISCMVYAKILFLVGMLLAIVGLGIYLESNKENSGSSEMRMFLSMLFGMASVQGLKWWPVLDAINPGPVQLGIWTSMIMLVNFYLAGIVVRKIEAKFFKTFSK